MERGKQKIEKTRGHGVDEKKAERVFCDVLAEFVRSWKLSKDIKFPAANLLQGGKWLSERKSRSSVNDVTLSFGEAYSISHIDVGNCGSSFITIEVSRGQQRYQTLLPSTELMSGRDAQAKKNWSSVHMFSKEHFVEDVVEQKWNTVRVTCLQPFLQNEQFGLSFLKIFSIAEDELPVQPTQQLPPPGSVFQMMRDGTLGRAGPMVVNRSQQLVLAAIENQRTSLKCSSDLREAAESSSNGRDNYFDVSSIEQHAAACGLTSGTDDSNLRNFPSLTEINGSWKMIGDIKEMPEVLDVGPQLEQLVAKQPEKQLPYVAVRGSVKALGSPLHSLGAPDVPAVIQKLTCKEHVVADQERTLQETVNSVPFALTGHKGTRVEVVDALAAEVLDLETVVDHFEPSAPGLVDHLWGFFTGVRQRGLQNTEDVLREGALLTGVGTLTLVPSDPKGDLHLVPPADGAPFFLTAMSLHTLARHLDREKRMYKWLAVTFGAVGLILVGAAARRWWRSAERRAADAAAREATEVERRERRRRARSARDRDNVPEALLCVVCRLRERELVLLPCGHVCLCEECGEAVGPRCPVCRAQIEKRTAAYVAVKNICYLVDQGAIFNQDLSETTISLNFKLQCSFLQKLPQATVPESRADCILWFFSNKNQ
ncbi:Mitochondrial E3 ubiquitin protein ligase 1, partial [Gryllus bimaculatus]